MNTTSIQETLVFPVIWNSNPSQKQH